MESHKKLSVQLNTYAYFFHSGTESIINSIFFYFFFVLLRHTILIIFELDLACGRRILARICWPCFLFPQHKYPFAAAIFFSAFFFYFQLCCRLSSQIYSFQFDGFNEHNLWLCRYCFDSAVCNLLLYIPLWWWHNTNIINSRTLTVFVCNFDMYES